MIKNSEQLIGSSISCGLIVAPLIHMKCSVCYHEYTKPVPHLRGPLQLDSGHPPKRLNATSCLRNGLSEEANIQSDYFADIPLLLTRRDFFFTGIPALDSFCSFIQYSSTGTCWDQNPSREYSMKVVITCQKVIGDAHGGVDFLLSCTEKVCVRHTLKRNHRQEEGEGEAGRWSIIVVNYLV